MPPADPPASGSPDFRADPCLPSEPRFILEAGLCLVSLVVGILVFSSPTPAGEADDLRLERLAGLPEDPRAGSSRPFPLAVRLRDPAGEAAQGETVVFSLSRGAGTLGGIRTDPGDTRLSVTTDGAGRARVFYRPGLRSGPVTVEARVPERDLSAAHEFRVRPAPTVRLLRAGGDRQRALCGREVPDPLVVAVRDTYGNPVPGRKVEFLSRTEGAVLDVNTDSEGLQSVGTSDNQGQIEVDLYRVSPTQKNNRVDARLVGTGSTVRFRLHGQPRLVSLNFREAPLPAVLRSLAETTGWNLVLPTMIDESPLADVAISVRLEDVTALQALDTILDLAGLTRVADGNVLRIVDVDPAGDGRQSLEAPGMITGVVPLHYRRARSVVSSLTAMQESSRTDGPDPGVSFSADRSTNSVLFTAPRSRREDVRALISRLDRRQRQVLIRGLILEYALEKGTQINPEFFLNPRGNQVTGAGDFTGRGGVALNAVDAALDKLGPGTFTALISRSDFQAVLNVLAGRTRSEILSKPQITALNNEEASIRVGSEQEVIVSRQTAEGLQTSLETIQAFTELNVTPTVTRDGHVRMDLVISSDDFLTGEVPEDVVSQINRRRTENSVLVEDGQTLVIGGLIEETGRDAEQGVPYLKDVPLLGALFRTRSDQERKSELLVFLTPRVIRSDTEGRSVSRAAVDEADGVSRPPGLVGQGSGTVPHNLNRVQSDALAGILDREGLRRVLRERRHGGYYESWRQLGRRASLSEAKLARLRRYFTLSVPRFDLNRVGPSTLGRLPGVNERLARDIVDYRSRHGAFRSVEDLRDALELDASRFSSIRRYLYVSTDPGD